MDPISDLRRAIAAHDHTARTFVTLSYAQSLDGSIALHPEAPFAISGAESLRLTHQLRAEHDAVLVGIGTVLADDPALTVRLAAGKSPRPIVLDSSLTIPETARIFDHPQPPIIVTSEDAPIRRVKKFVARDIPILPLSANAHGISLPELLAALPEMGIRSVMVEGGARVLASFLREKLADWALITIAPYFVGGLHAIPEPPLLSVPASAEISDFPKLNEWQSRTFEQDLVVWGTVI